LGEKEAVDKNEWLAGSFVIKEAGDQYHLLAYFRIENAKIYSRDFEAEISYTYFVIRGGVG
jgi:hypothetical protein